MNVLWVFAHPEPRSLSGALRDDSLQTLRNLGHDVRESDLYAMKWNPVVDAADYGTEAADERLQVGAASARAYAGGMLSPEIVAEQEKLAWADAVVVQFPLWWFGVPAILKGWIDRVFVKGFAYGLSGDDGRTLHYGEGRLAGKRAMVVVTGGASEAALGPRGINGSLDDLLFSLQHGTFFYTGMSVLPPYAVYGADRVPPEQFTEARGALRERLRTLETTQPLPYRSRNSGDYDENMVLEEAHVPGETGFAIHLR
ncbi:NAD(P)H-dependent oxidoreductase [Actinacidiphila glaucinigra]|uniref:NAD(P)H-dependent oxidoreductase n=1 Tax=Streptomycetaceae TaxID=2062 RepID=UPI002DD8108F|nr:MULTISPECIES: NAD(P)H-dependent oxidoreductase [Streptomycetaceae]WSD57483.1 NAD(P)H-dependent oxidoreductase [Actinacidiphila glaucinigra]WSD65162.1 NAD(P)H-dependent oxidoreductase [Actinacidiphila glaucinigra]WUB50263.1 NAD(P)H-dependent oxidoreductase [Streptomyces griseorubiginosus]